MEKIVLLEFYENIQFSAKYGISSVYLCLWIWSSLLRAFKRRGVLPISSFQSILLCAENNRSRHLNPIYGPLLCLSAREWVSPYYGWKIINVPFLHCELFSRCSSFAASSSVPGSTLFSVSKHSHCPWRREPIYYNIIGNFSAWCTVDSFAFRNFMFRWRGGGGNSTHIP